MEQFLQQTVVKLSPHSVKLIITCTPEQTYQTLYHTIQIIDAIDLLLINKELSPFSISKTTFD